MLVPITPSVLDWAIAESGYSRPELAASAGVDATRLERWITGDERPGLSDVRRIASKLHRQVATFLLPLPPEAERTSVQFRHPLGTRASRALTPVERRFVRRARRLQEAEAWLIDELGWDRPALRQILTGESADSAAALFRDDLRVTVEDQRGTRSASAAFDLWRSALESLGVFVLQFAMGEDTARGFSLWNEAAPVVVVNTAWPDEARIFTLFHEAGHLLSRTDSACARAALTPHAGDGAERWCEAFAAAVLIPRDALADVHRVTDVQALSSLAKSMRVSLRAMALRLIDVGKASWELYESIPAIAERKPKGGGGTARSRSEIRADEFGQRTNSLFINAVQRDVISQSQALDYLDIPSEAFGRLAGNTLG